ncbi:P-loop containing nucleoside triphosphate hydrolase protein [Lasiosphaeria ovina]|uniref:P-loop containing nucleoside triphosphate hydrolase protein n=1 Tax=Lasiosphaeria ovina TaxID=92902 RepID=A0AAE0KGC1_9PEZI|nr:P-loop containing nucleoside triphosphate hydrolase protein [Lasiosphaeria ovina]
MEGYAIVDTNHRYLLCSGILGGYMLKDREWKIINVSCCKDAKTNTTAIDHLVMKDTRKNLIKALVQKHFDPNTGEKRFNAWAADVIQNKGEGLIFLLHGGPECIAEYTGRPLISLACGDVGTDEETMENNLSYWFNLGEKWGAVMLIDEADIYLERRSPGDLKRNGLVSVLLRCIEYYRGILFLTTNRVGTFDDAFTSRIHVILHYEPLTVQDRRTIWENFIKKLQSECQDIYVTEAAKKYILDDHEITEADWNGREIRNAFQTAVQLAQYSFFMEKDKKEVAMAELKQEHLQEVCQMASRYKEYLHKVHSKSESGGAVQGKIRNDLEPLPKK